jgi:hypothetical protein
MLAASIHRIHCSHRSKLSHSLGVISAVLHKSSHSGDSDRQQVSDYKRRKPGERNPCIARATKVARSKSWERAKEAQRIRFGFGLPQRALTSPAAEHIVQS